MTGLALAATGRTRLQSFWPRLTCVQRANYLHLMNDDYGGFVVSVYFDGELQDARAIHQTC